MRPSIPLRGTTGDERGREHTIEIMQLLGDADPVLSDAVLLCWAAHPVVGLMIGG